MRLSGREEADLVAILEAEEGVAEDGDGEGEMVVVTEGEIETPNFEGIETREAENVTGSETETGAIEISDRVDRQSGGLDRQREMVGIFGIVIYLRA